MDRIQSVTAIGDFVIPPAHGLASRDFQTLHVDFGLPLDPRIAEDVARYTALFVARSDEEVTAQLGSAARPVASAACVARPG